MKWFWICLRPLTGRFLHSIITLWLITMLFFLLVELIPGDFATATATRDTTWEQIQTTRYQLGLFTSAPERYLQWLLGLLSGDLGTSWWVQKPITPLIAKRLWHSTWLVAWATALAIPLALSLALLAVAWRGRIFDRLSSIVGLTAISFPDFLVAYGLMALLAVYFDVFPVHTTYILDMPLADRLHATDCRSFHCQRRSKISPPGRSKTSPLDVMRYAVLGGGVPVVHRRDPRCFV